MITLYLVAGVYGKSGLATPEPVNRRQFGDDVSVAPRRKMVVEIHDTIAENIKTEIKSKRPKSRKVKRELAERIIDTAGFTGLLGAGIPAPVFRAVAAAVDAPRPDPALYEAIALALIRAADEADEEDAIALLLLAA